jgi:hypothetical protein
MPSSKVQAAREAEHQQAKSRDQEWKRSRGAIACAECRRCVPRRSSRIRCSRPRSGSSSNATRRCRARRASAGDVRPYAQTVRASFPACSSRVVSRRGQVLVPNHGHGGSAAQVVDGTRFGFGSTFKLALCSVFCRMRSTRFMHCLLRRGSGRLASCILCARSRPVMTAHQLVPPRRARCLAAIPSRASHRAAGRPNASARRPTARFAPVILAASPRRASRKPPASSATFPASYYHTNGLRGPGSVCRVVARRGTAEADALDRKLGYRPRHPVRAPLNARHFTPSRRLEQIRACGH